MKRYTRFSLALGLSLSILGLGYGRCPAQEPGKGGDDALDSLIEKLAEPKPDRPSGEDPKEGKDPKAEPGDAKAPAGARGSGAGQASKPGQEGTMGSGDVSGKDKELDELLEKLGETKDEPAAQGKPGGPPRPGQPGEPSGPGPGEKEPGPSDTAKGPDLQGKDREIDERLEEFAGKKRKKNRQEEEQGGGALAQLIKEMRDVEQKLGKPETGEETQAKQKQIVKQIETLIQQVKQSGSSGQMSMRMTRQQGQKPGEQQGQQPGANPGGAPPMKPGKAPDRHAMAGGKDIWGHLPAELRQEMENVFKEEALPAKEDLIKRYYLSIAKQKLQRGE